MPHQRQFAEWAQSRDGVASFMEMRLGKTLCIIRWAETRPKSDKILIVAPLSVIPTWERELRLEGHLPCVVTGTAAQRERAIVEAGPDHRWYVVNREGLVAREGGRTRPSFVARLAWDVVVVDESTCIRNPKAAVTRAALEWLAAAPNRAVMSGLPNPEGPEDVVTQMLFVRGGEFMGCGNFWEWRQRYMQPSGYSWTVTGQGLSLLRSATRADAFYMTRREAGIRAEKQRAARWINLPVSVTRAIRAVRRDMSIGDRVTMNPLTAQQWECQLTGGRFAGFEHDAKISEVLELVQGEFRRSKVVVWARYTEEIAAVSDALARARVANVVVTGAVSTQERRRRLEAFTSKGPPRVLVAQPKCLMAGVDLSAARVAIVYSNYFDLEIRAQLEDRIVHPMQTEPALIVDILARGTVDEDLVEALTDKRATASSFNKRMLEAAKAARRSA